MRWLSKYKFIRPRPCLTTSPIGATRCLARGDTVVGDTFASDLNVPGANRCAEDCNNLVGDGEKSQDEMPGLDKMKEYSAALQIEYDHKIKPCLIATQNTHIFLADAMCDTACAKQAPSPWRV